MFDFESRHIIEALRSGVPSRSVGEYFSSARSKVMDDLSNRMDRVITTGRSSGMVFSGKYGEGKTHLLNSAFNMAQRKNMVVSLISIGKETPLTNMPLLYQKIIANTYLPGNVEPGFSKKLKELTPNSPVGSEMQVFCAKNLESEKLYYLFRSFLSTDNDEEKYQLLSDLEGDFIDSPTLKKIYKRIFMETAKFSFSKKNNFSDYYSFMSHLFTSLGYSGWTILFDEVELTGRLGIKSRLTAYRNMSFFLNPPDSLHSVFSLFAISASYGEDVIDGKHDFDHLAKYYPDNPEPIHTILQVLLDAPQLLPLTRDEMNDVIRKIIDFHGRAYDWNPECSAEELLAASASSGYLLRTKLRTAIELLDQLYQYGTAGSTSVQALTTEDYSESCSESLDSLDSLISENCFE